VLHVDDLVDLTVLIAERPEAASGQIFNIGGGEQHTLSLLEALALLEQELGVEIRYDSAPARAGDQPIYVSDISRARAALGWTPSRSTSEGVRELCDWVRSSRELLRSITDGVPSA
jgi:CDP-paratose 2-epimerase